MSEKNRLDRMAAIIKENDILRGQIKTNNKGHLELSNNLGVEGYVYPTKWLPATAELLENDTRSVEEGKGYFWLLKKGATEPFHSRYCETEEFPGGVILHRFSLPFGDFCSIVDEVDAKIQPAQAPPDLEE